MFLLQRNRLDDFKLTGNEAYLHAGPRVRGGLDKVVTNMMVNLALFALSLSEDSNEKHEIISELRRLPNRLTRQLLDEDGAIESAIQLISEANSVIFIARYLSYPIEGALKMMEVAYLPCIAYPGGELKHGPIALIEQSTPIIAIAPEDSTLTLLESSIRV